MWVRTYRNKIAACAKHYVGDGGTINGIDENNTIIDWKGLLKIHMPGYPSSISKGVATIMISYSSWNGKKMHANRDLITGYLKNKLKFEVRKNILKEKKCYTCILIKLDNLNLVAKFSLLFCMLWFFRNLKLTHA